MYKNKVVLMVLEDNKIDVNFIVEINKLMVISFFLFFFLNCCSILFWISVWVKLFVINIYLIVVGVVLIFVIWKNWKVVFKLVSVKVVKNERIYKYFIVFWKFDVKLCYFDVCILLVDFFCNDFFNVKNENVVIISDKISEIMKGINKLKDERMLFNVGLKIKFKLIDIFKSFIVFVWFFLFVLLEVYVKV